MNLLSRVVVVLLAAVLSPSLWAQAAAPDQAKETVMVLPTRDRIAPLASKPAPVSSHAPFEAGDCKVCHQGNDPKQPGPLKKATPALCLDCHEEFADVLKRRHMHAPARTACTACHNPHNAAQPKLLLAESGALCKSCHVKTKVISETAKVKHRALSEGKQCNNCHDPHGSSISRLLTALPFELCTNCHNRDTMAGADGKKLQNMKALLDANPVWHGPVAERDCSVCHEPHGSANFRLLNEYYPPEFYAPYDRRNYELCMTCHREKAFSSAETTTLTGFRNGAQNLHFVHVQQGNRGRTCRACHEVHATKQKSLIREGVPYGSGGWVLALNYKRTETGGSCEKTCHQQRAYSRQAAR